MAAMTKNASHMHNVMHYSMFEIAVLSCLVRTEIFLINSVYCSCTVNKMHISPVLSQSRPSFRQHPCLYLQ